MDKTKVENVKREFDLSSQKLLKELFPSLFEALKDLSDFMTPKKHSFVLDGHDLEVDTKYKGSFTIRYVEFDAPDVEVFDEEFTFLTVGKEPFQAIFVTNLYKGFDESFSYNIENIFKINKIEKVED